MNLFFLARSYLKAKPLNTSLNILLLALGIAVITILLLFSNQIQNKITQNAKGIDLVVGAKGSPLQLILCNIFHIDFPTGNIKIHEAEKLTHHPLIKKAIPLALGDSYQNFRIVGTNKSYPDLYTAKIAKGGWWNTDLQTTIGANVADVLKLDVGDTFASAHGLGDGGHIHEESQYKVVGVMERTGGVLDNLILTNVSSVWKVHEDHDEEEDQELSRNTSADKIINPSTLVSTVEASDTTKEITSLLIQYRNPLAAIQLPRFVNSQSNMQAASPAFETARLFSILGIGVDIIMGFAYVLILISALSIFIALYNSLKERQYDLAIMRSMGASRLKLFITVLLEGSTMTFAGSLLGLLVGHGALLIFTVSIGESQQAGINALVFYSEEWLILSGSLMLGIVCSAVPAVQAYKTDIHTVLASI
jgi:putative ABC transport system permease protein